MDAQTLFLANQAIRELDKRITAFQYTNNRGGMIPPEDIPRVLDAVAHAADTLTSLLSK